MAIPASVNCFQQLTDREKLEVLFEILTKGIPKVTLAGQVAAATAIADVIPITAEAWSLSVVGANATITINGVATAVATGVSLSGVGPLLHPIRITTGATTTVAWSYNS